MGKQTFKGSCHCGSISYEFKLDDESRKASRCNCTWCQKGAMLGLTIPHEDFKLLKPDSTKDLGNYSPKNDETNFAHRYFCKTCGTQVWREGQYEFPAGTINKFFTLNLHSVDQPQKGIDLADFTVEYVDGLADNFMAGTKDKPYSGGVI